MRGHCHRLLHQRAPTSEADPLGKVRCEVRSVALLQNALRRRDAQLLRSRKLRTNTIHNACALPGTRDGGTIRPETSGHRVRCRSTTRERLGGRDRNRTRGERAWKIVAFVESPEGQQLPFIANRLHSVEGKRTPQRMLCLSHSAPSRCDCPIAPRRACTLVELRRTMAVRYGASATCPVTTQRLLREIAAAAVTTPQRGGRSCGHAILARRRSRNAVGPPDGGRRGIH